MKLKVTADGVTIPREMLPDVEEMEVREEDGILLLLPLSDEHDPIWDMGTDPVDLGLTDAAEQHDRYIYRSEP